MKKLLSTLLLATLCATAALGQYQRFASSRMVFVGDATPPTLASATIPPAGTSITLAFSEPVQFGAGGNAGWTPTLSGGASAMTYSSGNGTSSLVYTLARTVLAGETGTLAYTQPGAGVEDPTGNLLATFSGATITNNSTASSTPLFGAETQQWSDQGSGTADVITLTTGFAIGTRPVIFVRAIDATITLSSVTSTGGATWTVLSATAIRGTAGEYGVVVTTTANLTTALTTSDTVTLNWATVAGYCPRAAAFNYLTNCASSGQPDVAVSNSRTAFQDAAPTVSGTTVAANTVCVGMLFGGTATDTQSSPSWTLTSKLTDTTAGPTFTYHNAFSSAGSKTLSATQSGTCYWVACFAAFK